jgi:hypothetical protein
LTGLLLARKEPAVTTEAFQLLVVFLLAALLIVALIK